MGVLSAGGSNVGGYGGGGITGGKELRLPTPEHSCTDHCNQAHYGPMYGGGSSVEVKVGQAVVGAGRLALGGGFGGVMDGGGGGDGWDGDRGGLNLWEDTVANVILGMEYNETPCLCSGIGTPPPN